MLAIGLPLAGFAPRSGMQSR